MKKTVITSIIMFFLVLCPRASFCDETGTTKTDPNGSKTDIIRTDSPGEQTYRLRQQEMINQLRNKRLEQSQKSGQIRKHHRRREMTGKRRLRGDAPNHPRLPATIEFRYRQLYEKQMPGEVNKHRRRIARLNQIKKLAADENNTEIVAKAEKLLNIERFCYGRKCRKIRMKERDEKLKIIKKSMDKQE